LEAVAVRSSAVSALGSNFTRMFNYFTPFHLMHKSYLQYRQLDIPYTIFLPVAHLPNSVNLQITIVARWVKEAKDYEHEQQSLIHHYEPALHETRNCS
jgi:hypothetical protein